MVAAIELPDAPQPGIMATHTDTASLGASDLDDSDRLDPQTTSSSQQTAGTPQNSSQTGQTTTTPEQDRSAAQVKKQEKQRLFGVLPNFNISYDKDVPPLRPGQKFSLAFHTAKDPVTIVISGLNALYGQATDEFGPEYKSGRNAAGQPVQIRYEGYGQGMEGYGKRIGAAYADTFDGTMIGNAILPVLFKEDPRYFRRGEGTIKRRLLYSISTTVWCKRDNGTWGPNYANVIGNLAAGGISNIYYPSQDRGAGLTISRGLLVTAEGALGGLGNEFLPDITRHFLHRDVSGRRVDARTPTVDPSPVPAPPSPATSNPPAPRP